MRSPFLHLVDGDNCKTIQKNVFICSSKIVRASGKINASTENRIMFSIGYLKYIRLSLFFYDLGNLNSAGLNAVIRISSVS